MNTAQNDSNKVNLRFIIDRVISWPFIAFIVFLILSCSIIRLLNKAEHIKVGDFQLTVSEIAKSLGIENSIQDLNSLSYDELKVFLVIGGEDGDYYKTQFNNFPNNGRFEKILQNLSNKELIEIFGPETLSEDKKGKDNVSQGGIQYKTTTKGRKIHRAIIDAIYNSFMNDKIKYK